MCNPRRVIVTLAETVREEWQRTIEARVTAATEVSAQATLETQIDLGDELGPIALEELRLLLNEGFGGWQAADAASYTLTLEHGITLRYRPDAGHLEVQARLSETVEAAAVAQGAFQGTLDTEIAVEGEGRYYHDNWRGHSEARARYEAERAAQARLAATREELISAAAHAQAEAQANQAAQARLREAAERQQAILDERLETLLHASEEQVQNAIGNLLGQTYRRAIIRLVQDNGGQVIQDQEQGAVIDLVARI
ncbi:hypothetical protein [Candidatus Viridilinea mediisalina]|uniref:FtsH ternary system domain-containing protein n=1 Tax=Candidatus Viridilinea mediisalina TaxID=2024553 RepID=A0A2A6RGE2_9CHLR|nr:hypothetical protein [Candidatus Viridilinea mediisalina]PDW01948.1 hypothetical protein CJ255_16530 [Candidatus Viridilinea mediisalina]